MNKMRVFVQLAAALLLFNIATVEAVFQNWSSKAFQPGHQEKRATALKRQNEKDWVKAGKQTAHEQSAANFYQQTTPRPVDYDKGYLGRSHPLQEQPLEETQKE